MEIMNWSMLQLILLCCYLIISCHSTFHGDRKVYIVYMGDRPKGDFSATDFHTNVLQDVVGSGASDFLLHSYHRSFNGFVAKLTQLEKLQLEGKDGVVSVFRSRKKQLQTTRSWDFMGFSQNVTRSTYESDVIIGMFDTGIWPESKSFRDEGFGPPPKKWKGVCQGNSNFTCNNKVVGARYYHSGRELLPGEIASPRDTRGHGTHTASTAAGGIVEKASFLGFASGTARGGVPSARIAVYKICWFDGCSDADILAAFDDAIADGVDIISISVGLTPVDYFKDSLSIGAFHAMKNGILTSNSAGNQGPSSETILNFAPWALSVAASTIDRNFINKVMLGNGAIYEGVVINTFDMENKMYPIIYGGDAANTSDRENQRLSMYCVRGSMNKSLVQGKIVICNDELVNTEGAIDAGAVGSIMRFGIKRIARTFDLPVSVISISDEADILEYLETTSEPTATILKSTEYKDELAPYVVSFSSRGPNPLTPDIIKPDLTAPGVNILAAWTEAPPEYGLDKRIFPFQITLGTSMSCPHASAAAAYVKSFHPTWSPDAIKSALMTTAYPMNADMNPDAEFAYGSGHINPAKAANPGLVYDAGEIDYVKFLCGQGYSNKQLQILTGYDNTCSRVANSTVWDLNYPSFALSMKYKESITRTFHRTVTNVGSAGSSYKAIVNAPAGLQIQVQPDVLSFGSVGEKQSFDVTVKATMIKPMISGSLVWDDGVHQVRSPVVAHITNPDLN
ncbi:Subtilisin-like protease SBT4.3 [Euphorbia peplus]|nr:Subtilisin-like protease SBT4.3 [Euphorbia peplus]